MIGYICLVFALSAGLAKGFLGKSISRDVRTLKDGVAVNTVRSFFCAIIGLAVLLISDGLSGLALGGAGFLVCLCSSVCMAAFCIAWLYAYQNEAYVFLSIFTMFASILTGILGWLVFGDIMKWTRALGMLLLVVAVCIMSLYNKKIKGKITIKGAITLIIGGLGVALADFMQKVWTKGGYGQANTFTFYTYFIVLIPQILLLGFINRKKPVSNGLFDKRHLIIFFVISACLYVNVFTKTIAAKYLDSTLMYPTVQGANLILSAVFASLLFKEKMTFKSILAIIIALGAVILMNL